jgi:hypothetical protein
MEATTSIPHGNKLDVIVTTLFDTDKKNKGGKVFGCNNNSINQRNNFDFLFLEKQQKQQQKKRFNQVGKVQIKQQK